MEDSEAGDGRVLLVGLDGADWEVVLPLLGLFGESGMTSALDAEDPLRLKHMTQKALQLLTKSDKPFFLLIEGSQIDWCGHANDVACAMAEMNDFGETMKIVKAFAQKHGDTLVVATADHNTGGLSPANG